MLFHETIGLTPITSKWAELSSLRSLIQMPLPDAVCQL